MSADSNPIPYSETSSQSEASGEQDLTAVEEAVSRLKIKAWREGESGLEFRLGYLMLELATARENPEQWTLNTRSINIDQLDRAMRREEGSIRQLLENESLIWNRLGFPPRWENAAEIQPAPYRYADLIFLFLSVPHWIKAMDRKKYVAKGSLFLKQYRKDNPGALIVTVSDQPGFKLAGDPLFSQWTDIGKELSGVGQGGVVTGMIARQLTSPGTIQAYLKGHHTTHRMQTLQRQQRLQEHVNGIESLQTDFKLLLIMHPGLHETHSKRIWDQLRSHPFSSIEVCQQTEVRPEQLSQFDFFILVQCGFPEKFRNLSEFQYIAKRIYRFDGKLPKKLPQPREREFSVLNSLEERYLGIIEKVRGKQDDEKFRFLHDKYEEQWKLIQEKNNNILQISLLDRKMEGFKEGYYTLIESVLMEAIQNIHKGSRFNRVMKNLTRYLIVDDFNPDVIDYLAKRGFTRTNMNYMSSLEMFGHFNRFKEMHPQLKGPQAYQMFMRNDPLFSSYEVVLIHAWSFEKDGSLVIKLRLAPLPEEGLDTEAIAEDIVLSGRNLNQLLDSDPSELYGNIAAGASRQSEQGKEVTGLLEKLISGADLKGMGKMMGIKKDRLYNLYQLDQEIQKLSASLSDYRPTEEEVSVGEEPSAEVLETAQEQSTGEAEPAYTPDDDKWFMPIVRYQVDILYVIALACAIRWQGLAENRKAAQYLEHERKRTGEGPDDIVHRALVYAVTEKKELHEAGVLATFPDIGASRFVYGRELPHGRGLQEPEYVLYLIDMSCFQAQDVIEFLRQRNRSAVAHVPVLLLIPPGLKLNKDEDAMLGRLIGVRPGKEIDGLPMPYRIESLENAERVKHLVQGILNIDDNLIETDL